jgi:hypothetical protein
MASWNKEEILLDNGQQVQAQAPVIVSVSRSTDIPAFYAEWFLYRLKEKNYSAWTNPFNGVKSYVSYANTRFIVFWSKNPRPLIETGLLDYLDERGIKCYIQYSLNDYETEGLEKGVKPLDYRIKTFEMLVKRLGKGSVVWRFDPLILTDTIDVDILIEKIKKIGTALKGLTEKMVFSYADILEYSKVKGNLEKGGINYRIWTQDEMNDFAEKLTILNKKEGWNFTLATCGEKIDLNNYGIAHNKCIDGDLITRIAWKDKDLMKFMKINIQELTPSLFAPEIPKDAIMLDGNHYFISNHKKDSGQRALCGCMVAKDIGEYNTCVHLCEYCYANTSKNSALKNYESHNGNKYSDTITGR